MDIRRLEDVGGCKCSKCIISKGSSDTNITLTGKEKTY